MELVFDKRCSSGYRLFLSASYVGGFVNYFALAKLINASPDLLRSLATADLLIMAFFFAFLSISLDWKWLKSKFDIDRNSDGVTSASDATVVESTISR